MSDSLIYRIEKLIIEEMKGICGDIEGINWDEVRLKNDTDINWHSPGMDVYFYVDNEHPNEYKFCHDYKEDRGLLLIENKSRKPVNYREIKIWGTWEGDDV
ncbi:hypothetical protein [Bacillus sp. ISL-7]|uniref:hypothetical protein n=1 Tax=Bacillus sp. ISL-7 TaxID=2819136 RepID=UPI001BE4ECC7|nr:hypothetical protein [Bacillus sp. ISL-7]MBT2734748.1 hypothetical protein [Bacillus sp. ISL-7]